MKIVNHVSSKAFFFIWLWMFLIIPPAWSLSKAVNATQIPSDFAADNKHVSLSGEWKFKSGKLGKAIESISKEEIEHWEDIRVPANGYFEGKNISGAAWYSEFFTLPVLPSNKKVLLKFEGVDYMAEVWLNGKYIGMHDGYFQPFNFDISEATVRAGPGPHGDKSRIPVVFGELSVLRSMIWLLLMKSK